eukprot:9476582-Pyramimonas_sp.AAC.1
MHAFFLETCLATRSRQPGALSDAPRSACMFGEKPGYMIGAPCASHDLAWASSIAITAAARASE